MPPIATGSTIRAAPTHINFLKISNKVSIFAENLATPKMAKEKKVVKKKRVSFNIPVRTEDSDSDEPTVKISVTQDDSVYDSDIETSETGKGNSDEESSDEEPVEESSSELTDEENVTESPSKPEVTETGDDSDLEEDGDDDDESGEESSDGNNSDIQSQESSDSSEDDEEVQKEETAEEVANKPPPAVSSFGEMALDPRVERAIERVGWKKPTPVQSAVIPVALAARDVLVSAATGSGKTGAYAVPIVQHICRTDKKEVGPRAIVLVPTRELVYQVASVFKSLCKYIEGVFVEAVAKKKGPKRTGAGAKKARESLGISQIADIIVGTPAAIVKATNENADVLSGVDFVVVDEADLVLSYGYMKDAQTALGRIPVSAQAMLLSATLETEGMEQFKKVVLRQPLTIKVTTESDAQAGDATGAAHYIARLKNHRDRYLVAYAMLRLNVICGKVLIFMNHINSAFRLKLFLDQFKVKSAVLNSELPANSRMHCVQQFNAGVFDVLIASDESQSDGKGKGKKTMNRTGKREETKKRKRIEKDEEFGLSRGVDFRDVAAVFNFDIPETSISYTHRAGRTARAGKTGTVLTLICSDEEEKSVSDIGKAVGVHIGPLAFRMDQIEPFRYRVEDCLRMVTDNAVSHARMADIRREIVNSEQLQEYFEDNPQDLNALQHNLSLAKNIHEHLAHVPSYLLPPALRGTVSKDPRGSKFRTKRKRGSGRLGKQKNGGDPLKNFTNKGVAGSSRQRFQERHGIVKKAKKSPGQLLKKKRQY